MSTHLVIGDQHASPMYHNNRADWLGRLICDVRPDVVVNIGDSADLSSLFQVSKGSFCQDTYRQEIDSHLDFQERTWRPVLLRKKKLPRRIHVRGNHDHRIQQAIAKYPQLANTISPNDLRLSDWYDDIIDYEGVTPGAIEVDGITYAHYLISGTSGKALASEHMSYTLLSKYYQSCTVGHTHTFDLAVRTRADGTKIWAANVGCYQDYTNEWAGEIGKLWDRGILIKRNVDKGEYDPEWISLESIKKEYAN